MGLLKQELPKLEKRSVAPLVPHGLPKSVFSVISVPLYVLMPLSVQNLSRG
jgi:hypothetical protein